MEDNGYSIEYLPQFKTDFFGILYYISYILENEYAANKMIKNVYDAIMKRKHNAIGFQVYRNISNRENEWYRIYVGNYTIFYTVKYKKMIVARIFYSKRNFDNLF